ncbi:MAG: 30S ribosomal protein S8 [Candidatus Komeilibacteria bacterium CG11_big_fil_rev_8_21_14_0_20_36_20]|uniref:Small ribosomal subunit protein uS8 n=1 Tax=Candidatus Komeilibacteria bacterium CG11_big_fil_rev_8_21_14_0_20_36_20 TaxID=1974477 RepID=A0A2H0NDP6_9BACT|nr:MAG: 30S ribosomal protein S8 [Candidatus Komeilibacteria bacterium CG11_big_fil_rev_8_21_14_0_20_36_20]PIR81392.1 MAG: 30S ribosomal protein S8 [Candidatus Komeilibacteria bacterium CG10_big_fil_rev_8_21_14_0_10_36_65]PJC55117.1 MAG: 30S ribosomal protein S8 [Candidatus Komeilibacteria bacterium CG_4_9_14_0_2_um_filter_36_13]
MTDPIADMLTRIRNAVAVKKPEVILPFSKVKFNVAKILEQEKYVSKVEKIKNGRFDEIRIVLHYQEGEPIVKRIQRVSRPGQRIYVSSKEIPRILGGYGIAIISTSKGVMTNKEAKKQNLGGELMCEVW